MRVNSKQSTIEIMTALVRLQLVAVGILLANICIIESGDIDYMETLLRNYFDKPRDRIKTSDYKARTAGKIRRDLNRFGIETGDNRFMKNDSLIGFNNLIGVLKGDNFGTADDRLVGVAAHYDTVPESPGVDDNGSGVVALLEVARRVTSGGKGTWKRNNTIIFLVFDGTENDLAGSEAYVTDQMLVWLIANYGANARSIVPHGVIVLDSIMVHNRSVNSQHFDAGFEEQFGEDFPVAIENIRANIYRGDFIALAYRQPSLDKILADVFHKYWRSADSDDPTRMRFRIELFPLPFYKFNSSLESRYQMFLQSDHHNLWVDQVPAIYVTDTARYRGFMKECFHKSCDNIEMVVTRDNMAFLSKTADVVANAVIELSVSVERVTSTAADETFTSTTVILSVLSLLLSQARFR